MVCADWERHLDQKEGLQVVWGTCFCDTRQMCLVYQHQVAFPPHHSHGFFPLWNILLSERVLPLNLTLLAPRFMGLDVSQLHIWL